MQLPSSTNFLPHLAYDSVVFGFTGERLKILIMEYHQTKLFALPGGFVRRDEHLNVAVRRGLRERTGIDDIYLEQFYTFGDADRYRPDVMDAILKANGLTAPADHWLLDRFVSVAYYALIDYHTVTLRPDALSDSINWYSLEDLPPLLFDHREIVDRALATLRENLGRKLVGMNLLPPLFTMRELQQVYEAILDEKLHRSSFQRKMLATGLLERREKRWQGKAHKAPYQYSFVEEVEG